uniref:Putative cleavage and polyadenylation specificity factor subunit 3-II n=1 Tax=Davidia involucrata TaxID=16924 RepID=A0A5B7B8U1_DAVIN
MEKSHKAKVIHQDELLDMLREQKHEVKYAFCCPVHFGKFERIENTDLLSTKDVLPISDKCSWLHLLFVKVSNELTEGNIQDFGEHLQVESFRASVCLKDNCPYRSTDSSHNKSEAVYFCCTWSLADEKLARKVIAIMKNLDANAV